MSKNFERLNIDRLKDRSIESLIGICRGLLADQQLNEAEIRYLDLWLRDNQSLLSEWPGSVVADRVNRVLSDGVVTTDELGEIVEVLSQLIGGTLIDSGAADGVATSLPLDTGVQVAFLGAIFCFTGAFVAGSRRVCEETTASAGGTVTDTVTRSVNYLVVGAAASKSWANSSFGRKIEQAVKLRDSGLPMKIIDERCWAEALRSRS